MASITNFDTLNALRVEAARTGAGSRGWIGFATAMFDSFPKLYETAKRMNAEAAELRGLRGREQSLRSALRELVATLDLFTDCMDGRIDRAMLDLYIENAEALLGDGEEADQDKAGDDGIVGHFLGSWICADTQLPDADTTVFVCTRGYSEPVWLGYHDGEVWRSVVGPVMEVFAWSDLPEPACSPVKEVECHEG